MPFCRSPLPVTSAARPPLSWSAPWRSTAVPCCCKAAPPLAAWAMPPVSSGGLLGQPGGTVFQLGEAGHQGIRPRRKLLGPRLQGGQTAGGIGQCRTACGGLAHHRRCRRSAPFAAGPPPAAAGPPRRQGRRSPCPRKRRPEPGPRRSEPGLPAGGRCRRSGRPHSSAVPPRPSRRLPPAGHPGPLPPRLGAASALSAMVWARAAGSLGRDRPAWAAWAASVI